MRLSILGGLLSLLMIPISTFADDYLVQFAEPTAQVKIAFSAQRIGAAGIKHLAVGAKIRDLGFKGWSTLKLPADTPSVLDWKSLKNIPGVVRIQPNYKIRIPQNPELLAMSISALERPKTKPDPFPLPFPLPDDERQDNPDYLPPTSSAKGQDPLINNQWGMEKVRAQQAVKRVRRRRTKQITIAVIDTGVDYTHEDLTNQIWRNSGEVGTDRNGLNKETNGIDDDNNGYIDDVIGWDFADNDNRPYDLLGNLFLSGNAGHGTHCAGTIAAQTNNAIGITGIASNVKIMPLRFLDENGVGSTADAIEAIKYAVDNGAHITSNSWGHEGPRESPNKALQDMIKYSQRKGRLFVSSAGNGRMGVGYDNDTDDFPNYPASFSNDIIISVAATNIEDQLGEFSNWGRTSVDIAAPGVDIYSTTVGDRYDNAILGLASWSGTSMAAPFVSGALGLYMSKNPNKSWRTIKRNLLRSVNKAEGVKGKVSSDGVLDVYRFIRR